MSFRVVLADDSALLREGIARLLQDEGIDVVGQAGEAHTLLELVAAHRPDVAVIDIRMPPPTPSRASMPPSPFATITPAPPCCCCLNTWRPKTS